MERANPPKATASIGLASGVHGESYSKSGFGIYGIAYDSSGDAYGVFGLSRSTSGRGVYGIANAYSGTTYGVRGEPVSSSGYGVFSVGDLGCSGNKYFVQPHPGDPSKEVRFVCLEGNESGTYFRGTAKLEGGRAVIEVPEAFRLVTEEEGLTVQVTPMGLVRMGVEEKSLNSIVVVGEADVVFDYFVNGVRKGFAKFEPIQENHEWVPEYKDRPFGTQYPEALRRILVENGTLNPDFTPNEETAARMGWELRDYELDIEDGKARLSRAKEPDSPEPDPLIPKRDRSKIEEPDLEPPLDISMDLDRKERPEDPDHPREKPANTSPRDEASSARETAVKQR